MKILALSLIIFLFISCGGNGKSKPQTQEIFGDIEVPKECSIQSKKEFVFNVMNDSYLWSKDVKSITVQRFDELADSEAVLKELQVSDDRFSNIVTVKEYTDLFEAGVSSGFGYFPSLIRISNAEFINIDFIYSDSPASKVGLKRGDLIEFMDNNSIYTIIRDMNLYNKYFGNGSDENLTVLLKLKEGTEINITKAEFSINTVLHQSIVNQGDKKIGYLVFESFISKSYDQIESSFKEFKKQGIDELVLDLRYNGGGIVDVANYLSSMIGGDFVEDKVFNKYLFNEKYTRYNSSVNFKKDLRYSLNLSRVFVITTNHSCSASELVINSLNSGDNKVEVIQIGSSTCGKPYGMIGGAFCDKYILPVQFKSVNSEGMGDYIDGIAPTCQAIDDIIRDFGDINESSFFSTLYYIKNGSCKKLVRSKQIQNRSDILKGFKQIYGLY